MAKNTTLDDELMLEHEFDFKTEDPTRMIDPTLALKVSTNRKNSLELVNILVAIPQTRAYLDLLTQGEQDSLKLAIQNTMRKKMSHDDWLRYKKLAMDVEAYKGIHQSKLALPATPQLLALPAGNTLFYDEDIDQLLNSMPYNEGAVNTPYHIDTDNITREEFSDLSDDELKGLAELCQTYITDVKEAYELYGNVLVNLHGIEESTSIFVEDSQSVEVIHTNQFSNLYNLNESINTMLTDPIIEVYAYPQWDIQPQRTPPPIPLEAYIFEDI